MFEKPLVVGKPNIGDRRAFNRHVSSVFRREWLSNFGPLTRELEARLEGLLGVRHVVSVCNATVGLEIAARALALKGEVIVPSFTFVATAHALKWLGLQPVFADVDGTTHNLDPKAVRRCITPRTSGILAVHIWGRPCVPDELRELADEHGLKLLFDAAHAFGCSHNGRMIGSFGDCEVFSFHATKVFNTFEGGAITTNDEKLAARLREMSNFGFTGIDTTSGVGINGKMNEACAAMGLANLESYERVVDRNRANQRAYAGVLGKIPGIRLVEYDPGERANYHYVVAEIDSEGYGLSRDALYQICRAENIMVRRYFHPGCHGMEPYRSERDGSPCTPLGQTERLCERVLVFPNGGSVTPSRIRRIGEFVEWLGAEARQRSEGFADVLGKCSRI